MDDAARRATPGAHEIDDRRRVLRRAVVACVLASVLQSVTHAEPQVPDATLAPGSDEVVSEAAVVIRAVEARNGPRVEGHLDVHRVTSRVLSNERRLFVLLPPTYDEDPARRYGVIYAFDGQDLFDDALASGGEEWAVDELLSRRPPGVRDVIVVAIEAAPTAVREHAPPGSRPDALGDAYVELLTNEIKPFVDRSYRTLAAREHCFVMGLGSSALLAVYAAWSRAHVYAGAIAFEFPDVDVSRLAWIEKPATGVRPWLWLEQRAAERSRQSTTQLLTLLRRGADVQVLVAGLEATRPARVLAALRALPTH